MRLPFCVMDKKLTFATPRVLIIIQRYRRAAVLYWGWGVIERTRQDGVVTGGAEPL
jgi:hypothetical protein